MPNQPENRAGLLKFIPGQTLHPIPRNYEGLDLGQRRDHSALAGLELRWHFHGRCPVTYANLYQPELAIRSLLRFPLGTPYDKVIDLVADKVAANPHKTELVIDAGGPGPPIIETLRRTLARNISLKPVMITNGRGQNSLTGGYTGIPRRTLVTNLLLAISTGSIVCDDDIDNWDLLEEEMMGLRGDTTHPATAKGHDDLIMAVCLALSAAVRDNPILLPAANPDANTIGYRSDPIL